MLGWVKDLYSLQEALTLAGIIFLVLSILTAILFLAAAKEMNQMSAYRSRTRPS
jgi:hypothetical protein